MRNPACFGEWCRSHPKRELYVAIYLLDGSVYLPRNIFQVMFPDPLCGDLSTPYRKAIHPLVLRIWKNCQRGPGSVFEDVRTICAGLESPARCIADHLVRRRPEAWLESNVRFLKL